MENFPTPLSEANEEQFPLPENTFVYPPKFKKQEQSANIWLRSITSLALYLILGYYIFPSYKTLLLITAIVIFHELGHFFAMKYFRYNDLGIFFIPLLGAYVSGSKREVSQKESAIILLAGPLPGIMIGIIFHIFYQNDNSLSVADIRFETISSFLIFLNLINLFPVYPLDGGQLLNRIFLEEESVLSKVFVFLSAGLMGFIAWKLSSSGNLFYLMLLIFPIMMLLRLFGDTKMTTIEKRLETEGINVDRSYEELSDADYWKIRNILIEEHPSFKDIPSAPPYEYGRKEEKIMTAIQNLLHRHLIQDVSIAGKLFILVIWMAAVTSPWLLKMDMSLFHRFGF